MNVLCCLMCVCWCVWVVCVSICLVLVLFCLLIVYKIFLWVWVFVVWNWLICFVLLLLVCSWVGNWVCWRCWCVWCVMWGEGDGRCERARGGKIRTDASWKRMIDDGDDDDMCVGWMRFFVVWIGYLYVMIVFVVVCVYVGGLWWIRGMGRVFVLVRANVYGFWGNLRGDLGWDW